MSELTKPKKGWFAWEEKGYMLGQPLPPDLAENVRKHNKMFADWRERLGEGPFHCPDCGSASYSQWCLGWWPYGEHYHDPNRKTCFDCGREWWIVCPNCDNNVDRNEEWVAKNKE